MPGDLAFLLKAAHFAAEKHAAQRRKGASADPYINHPLKVASLLANVGDVSDSALLAAALLHDTVEDTATTPEELEQEFGPDVRSLVAEVTDDKSLAKDARKQAQIDHAPHLSPRAKQLKIADKTCNVQDTTFDPPPDWSKERLREYVEWAVRVVAHCRGMNTALEGNFDSIVERARARIG